MKRLAALTGLFALALVVAGCGDKKNESDGKDQQASNDAAGGMPAGGMPETPDGGMPGDGMHDGPGMPGDSGGSPYSGTLKEQHQALRDDVVKTLNELADALESVRDAQSAQRAAVRINGLADRLVELKRREDSMPKLKLPIAELQSFDQSYLSRAQRAGLRVSTAALRAGQNSEGDQSFIAAAERLEEAVAVTQGQRPVASYQPSGAGGSTAPPGYPVAGNDGGMPPGGYPGAPGPMPPGGYPAGDMPPGGHDGPGPMPRAGYPGAPGGAVGGDPKQQYEAILKGYVASLNHMAEALETIEDKELVAAAAETINVSSDELVELKRQASSVRLPDAEKRELDTKYDPQLREAARRILRASEQAGQYAAGEKAYFDALLRMTAARDVQQGKKPPASYMGSGAQVAGRGGRMPPGGYPMGFGESDMPPGGFPGAPSPEVGSATAPGFPGGFPGAPGGGPGAASQVPSFPEGSAKSAVVQFCVGIRDNKISDLGEIISPKATGTLEELRSSKVSDAKLKELQALLGNVRFAGERQEPDGSPVLYVQNAQRQRVKFKCEREGKVYVIRDMDQIETPRRPVRPVRRRPY